MTYRVYAGRWDIPMEAVSTFVAENDEEAELKFQKLSNDPSHAWDNMYMVEVMVVEQTRRVSENESMKKMLRS